jgi:hypothetical protein
VFKCIGCYRECSSQGNDINTAQNTKQNWNRIQENINMKYEAKKVRSARIRAIQDILAASQRLDVTDQSFPQHFDLEIKF